MTFVQHSMLLLKCFINIFKMLFLHQLYNILKMLVKCFFVSSETLL